MKLCKSFIIVNNVLYFKGNIKYILFIIISRFFAAIYNNIVFTCLYYALMSFAADIQL